MVSIKSVGLLGLFIYSFFVTPNQIQTELLQQGVSDLLAWEATNITRKGLLCSTFVKTDAKTLVIMRENMAVLPCDWAIVFYNVSNEAIKQQICTQPVRRGKVVHCQESAVTREFINAYIQTELSTGNITGNNKDIYRASITKPVMYIDISPHFRFYEKVLVADADISFATYDMSRALDIWDCAAKYPPLITQPLISGRKVFGFLHESTWRKHPSLMYSSQFLEMQTPMFDARFLEWFSLRLLKKTWRLHILHGSNWGIDTTWCKAALAYGKHVLRYPKYSVSCGILTGIKRGVKHKDTQSIPRGDNWKQRY
jgi:hypothetical protein